MKFCWCTIRTKNIEESLRFYKEIVGLSVSRRFQAGPQVEICFLTDGQVEIELIYDPNYRVTDSKEGISLGFTVKSVDEIIEYIKEKGIALESGPVQPNPHVKFFFVKDPNGVSIQFIENM
jgi:lactoylglutathione lyase